jgi:hypothetical protein
VKITNQADTAPRRLVSIGMCLCFVVMGVFARSGDAATPGMGARDGWSDLGSGVLKDGKTGLQWTQADNGRDVDWETAKSYCAGKGAGWRLPQLEELSAIYAAGGAGTAGTRCAAWTCKVSPLFKLTATWFWSATPVTGISDADELAWGVTMVNGAQTQALRFAWYGSRTLCVRSPQ